MSWGSSWSGPLAGGRDHLRAHPALMEAFGAEPSRFGVSAEGASGRGVLTDTVSSADGIDEIPKVFSLQAQQQRGQGSLISSSLTGFGTGSSSLLGASGTTGGLSLHGGFYGGSSSGANLHGSAYGGGSRAGSSAFGGWGQEHLLKGAVAVGSDTLCGGFSEGLGSGSSNDPCWVTVFGFPARMATAVRQQLEAVCGHIAEVCYGDGNFMHVRFQSPQAASACLALNGQTLLGKLMIGCTPCAHSVLLAASAGATGGLDSDEAEQRQRHWQQWPGGSGIASGGHGAMAGAPWSSAAVGRDGPQVRRNGLFWRLLDHLFDI
eukprot:TRINITY_DN18518_c0_g1_i1.p1 TRINITY_DN18518_c0_g1~~TRINITY_DN18518_c0_g1_i1.p1  ORF type:complete len:320 (+),score=73.34 TRINITY_DN18518_c0_g1_i1:72-1031(+)